MLRFLTLEDMLLPEKKVSEVSCSLGCTETLTNRRRIQTESGKSTMTQRTSSSTKNHLVGATGLTNDDLGANKSLISQMT